MRQKNPETVSLKRRAVSILLTLAVLVTAVSFCFATTVSADSGKYYFDLSKNTSWIPESGERLAATFTSSGSGGSQVGSVVYLTQEKTDLYSFTAPSGAANVQLYLLRNGYTMPGSAPANGKTRVFLNNTNTNWKSDDAPPRAYAWTNGDEMDFDSSPLMTPLVSGSKTWYYYDTDLKNVIFHNGKGQQTGDLAISGDNLVFSKYAGNSGWDSLPYYKKYAAIGLESSSDVIYAMPNGDVKFSKYKYSSSDPRPFTHKTVWLYNPSLSSTDTVKVKWDLNDPYDGYSAKMAYDSSVGAGFFKADVPKGAKVEFSYGSVTRQTVVPDEAGQNCYIANYNKWLNRDEALGEKTDYTASIESRSSNDTGKAFWVNATYFDYYSDKEYDSGWLNPIQAGTGHNGSSNDWFEFKRFNEAVNQEAKSSSGSWIFPLYFGNMCGVTDSFDGNQARDDNRPSGHKGYMGPNITGLTNFDYLANNSNGLWANGQDAGKSPDYNYSVRGLVYGSLDANGNIQYANGYTMPYFNADWISSKGVGKSVKSSFPFRQIPQGNDITMYSFDSENGADNVFFNWNGKTPQSVGYGQGSNYAVEDGLSYFMNQTSGKGIFPFNNTSSTRGSKSVNLNGGKENINYGFGVKMDMDFRVPENGKLPNGSDVTFHYSGDDDLWVYITPYGDNGELDYSKSQLVLDLGGNHKKAVGDINFASMTSTAQKSVLPTVNSKYNRNSVYIVDSYNWGDNIWIWAWNDTSDGKWYKAQYDSASGCYRVGGDWGPYGDSNGDRFDSKTKFLCTNGKENWGSQTAQDTIVNHLGKKTYTNNLRYAEDLAVSYDFKGNVDNSGKYIKNWGFEAKRDTAYQTLDPAKTYHMTVFYMERGMLESNCEIQFTMTPAQNDLIVEKTVNTADFNAGLSGEIPAQEFTFINSENGKTDKAVTYTKYDSNPEDGAISAYTTTMSSADAGTYRLGHGDSADFNFQYDTGSTIIVSERYPGSGIEYSGTKYQVTDEKGNIVIPKTSGTSTSAFKLINKKAGTNEDDPYSNVTRIVSFENTPKTAPLTIGKDFVDENGDSVTDSGSFGFRLLIDMDGSGLKPYKLAYEVNGEELYTNDNGEFWFSSEDIVTLGGLPAGASFTLQELPTSGYVPYKATLNGSKLSGYGGSYSNIISGTVSTNNSFIITNQQKPTRTELRVRKYLAPEGQAPALYTNGNLFTFKLEGLDETNYGYNVDDVSKDASGMKKEISETDSNGEAVFKNEGGSDTFLKFTEDGVYLFRISEVPVISEIDDSTIDSDIKSFDTQKYFAKVEVINNAGALEIGSVDYYKAAPGYVSGAVTAASFGEKLPDGQIPEFNNVIKPGKVTINKTDNANAPLNGVVFSLYKLDDGVYDSQVADISGKQEKVYDDDEIASVLGIDIDAPASEMTTGGYDTDGKPLGTAVFDNLDIYKRDGAGNIVYTQVPATDDGGDTVIGYYQVPEYQAYAVLEKSTVDGHAKSKVVGLFKLPVKNSYSITFGYVNGKLKNPDTAGIGTDAWRIIGISAIALSVLALFAYVLYSKKRGYLFIGRRK